MLCIGQAAARTCQGLTRREILQVGGIGFLGLTLADWFRAKDAQAGPASAGSRDPACIFIFLSGGPSHFETFDPKPAAPIDIRGPYGTIPTRAPGIRISELLPQIAEQMDKCALIRSMTSRAGDHSGTFMLSGGHRSNASLGAVLQQLKGATRSGLPPFVHVGSSGYLPAAARLARRTIRCSSRIPRAACSFLSSP